VGASLSVGLVDASLSVGAVDLGVLRAAEVLRSPGVLGVFRVLGVLADSFPLGACGPTGDLASNTITRFYTEAVLVLFTLWTAESFSVFAVLAGVLFSPLGLRLGGAGVVLAFFSAS